MNRLRRNLVVIGLIGTSAPVFAVGAGGVAPSFALPNAAGQMVALETLRGKIVYVDFWASWCSPCRRSFPWMNEMTRRYGPEGLTIVAINVDKKREDADKFLKQTPAEFIVVYDPAGTAPAAWEVMAMPTSFVVDSTGKVVFVESGFKDERKGEMEGRIRQALGVR
jgi:cytochrome c biogenesis protein CcmG, thiol:disulfide interchange protein DsbE